MAPPTAERGSTVASQPGSGRCQRFGWRLNWHGTQLWRWQPNAIGCGMVAHFFRDSATISTTTLLASSGLCTSRKESDPCATRAIRGFEANVKAEPVNGCHRNFLGLFLLPHGAGGWFTMWWLWGDGWVPPRNITSPARPLVDAATGIIQHMNTHHGSSLIELAHALAGIESEEVTMTSVDRLGFHIRFQNPGWARVAHGSLSCGKYIIRREARSVVVDMVAESRKK